MPPPTTPTQQVLCEIWSHVFGIDHIGIHDDFFSMGGDSLSALEMIELINTRLDAMLPVSTLIECPTVALLEPEILINSEPDLPSNLIRFQRGCKDKKPLFLVHGLLGHIFLAPDFLDGIHPLRPVYGLEAIGLTTDEPPARTISEVVRNYVEAIETVTEGKPFYLGGFCHGNLIVIEMVSLLHSKYGFSPTPILIDPPVKPLAYSYLKGPFGRVRLAMRRFHPIYLDEADLQRRLNKPREGMLHWRPETAENESNSQRLRTAANMHHLLTHHVLKACPVPPIFLTSRDRGRKVFKSNSFWNKFTDSRMSIHIVAETHKSIFGEDRNRVFNCVNEILEDQDLNSAR